MKKLMVANGKYLKDGVEKTNWVEVGIINTSANGKEYCLLNPVINLAGFPREEGKDRVIASIFDDANQQPRQQQQSQYGTPQPPPPVAPIAQAPNGAPITLDPALDSLPF